MTTRKKIIVVEDDAAILQLLQDVLTQEGFEVASFTEATSFRTAMTAPYPDLILMDLWLDEGTGQDLVKFLKSGVETKRIPVVLLSASTDLPAVVKETGANDFLPKPFGLEELLSMVRKYT